MSFQFLSKKQCGADEMPCCLVFAVATILLAFMVAAFGDTYLRPLLGLTDRLTRIDRPLHIAALAKLSTKLKTTMKYVLLSSDFLTRTPASIAHHELLGFTSSTLHTACEISLLAHQSPRPPVCPASRAGSSLPKLRITFCCDQAWYSLHVGV